MIVTMDKIIETWKMAHGGKFSANERLTQIMQLIKTLSDNGFGEESLNTSFKNKVIDLCTNKKSKKIKIWRELVEKDLNEAIIMLYPGPELSTITEEDVKTRSGELKVLIARLEDSHQKAKSKLLEPDGENNMIEEYQRISEDLDRRIFKNTPMPDAPVSEDEFLSQMGLKSDD